MSEGEDDASSFPDETTPKLVSDEIEAILSTPKKTKQTAKESSKKPSMENTSDKVTPVDHNSHDDHSELSDKKVVSETREKLPSQKATDDHGQPITHEAKELKSNAPVAPPVKQKPVVVVKPKPTSKPQSCEVCEVKREIHFRRNTH